MPNAPTPTRPNDRPWPQTPGQRSCYPRIRGSPADHPAMDVQNAPVRLTIEQVRRSPGLYQLFHPVHCRSSVAGMYALIPNDWDQAAPGRFIFISQGECSIVPFNFWGNQTEFLPLPTFAWLNIHNSAYPFVSRFPIPAPPVPPEIRALAEPVPESDVDGPGDLAEDPPTTPA